MATGPRQKLCIRREIAIAASKSPRTDWKWQKSTSENKGYLKLDFKKLPAQLRFTVDALTNEAQGRHQLKKGGAEFIDQTAGNLIEDNLIALHAGSFSFSFRSNPRAKTAIEQEGEKQFLVTIGGARGMRTVNLFNQVAEGVVQEQCPTVTDDEKEYLKSAFLSYLMADYNYPPSMLEDACQRISKLNKFRSDITYSPNNVLEISSENLQKSDNSRITLASFSYCTFGQAESKQVAVNGGYDRSIFEKSLSEKYLPATDGESCLFMDLSNLGVEQSMQKFASDFENDPSIIFQMDNLPLSYLATAYQNKSWVLNDKMPEALKESKEFQELLLKRKQLGNLPEEFILPEMLLANFNQEPGMALRNLPKRTRELCERACRIDGACLEYVPNEQKTPGIFRIAIEKDGNALQYVPRLSRTKDLCELAVSSEPNAIEYVPEKFKTDSLCLEAVKAGCALRNIPENMRTEEMCKIAVSRWGDNIEDVPKEFRTPELWLIACTTVRSFVNLDDDSIPEDIKTGEFYRQVVLAQPRQIDYVPDEERTSEMLMAGILDRNDPYIPDDMLLSPFEISDKKIKTLKEFADKYNDDLKIGLKLKNLSDELQTILIATLLGSWEIEKEDLTEHHKQLPGIQKKMAGMHMLAEVPADAITAELCEIAVDESGLLDGIPEQMKTPKLYLDAIKKDSSNFNEVPNALITEEFCRKAISSNPETLQYIPAKFLTQELCDMAVSARAFVLEHVPTKFKTAELCMQAAENGAFLSHIPAKFKTPDIYQKAIENSQDYTNPIDEVPAKYQTQEIWEMRVNEDNVEQLPKKFQTEEFFANAILKQCPYDIGFVPEKFRTPAVYMAAICCGCDVTDSIPENMLCPYPYVVSESDGDGDQSVWE